MADVQTSTHPFQAEVAAVLRLVTNSLYTNREIFLRELVSNASDALDKARFQALVDKTLEGQELPARIDIVADAQRGVLVVEDTGIGMTAEEAAQNLGTIAHSGTLKFLEQAAARGEKPDLDLIGQFGVGFYSAFMVADRIDVHSRSATPGSTPVHWSSNGEGSFTVQPGDKPTRGTRIELHLREDAKEFLDHWRLQHLVKRYSDYVLHPIHLSSKKDDGTVEHEPAKVNQAKAFWTQNPKSLGDEDYAEFYKHVMGGFVLPAETPLARLHVSMDAPIQFHAVLFVPDRRPLDLFQEDAKHLQLYARRVLVMESCDKLLPSFLRFFRGVVDSEDLPLNVSRETLQEHGSLAAIRRQLTRKALNLLAETAKDRPEQYAKIWQQFGVFLKEGVHTDSGHREQLTELLRFASTANPAELVSLKEYVDAMPPEQDAIYYITGEHAEDLAKSPHLEACRARGWAVLLMTDAVDEWVVQDLDEYAGKRLLSVTKGELDLPQAETKADAGAIAALVERAKATLGDRVKDVRASKRLTQSAACLVDDEAGLGRNMERILRMAGRDVRARARVLELNADHPFVRAAQTLAAENGDDPRLPAWIELLHDQAHLAEGSVPDPAAMVRRIQSVLDRVAGVAEGGDA